MQLALEREYERYCKKEKKDIYPVFDNDGIKLWERIHRLIVIVKNPHLKDVDSSPRISLDQFYLLISIRFQYIRPHLD